MWDRRPLRRLPPLAGTHDSGFRSRPAGPATRVRGLRLRERCPPRDARAARGVMRFWEEVLGGAAHPHRCRRGHDRQLAWTSHLPQAVAYALAKSLADRRLGGVSYGSGARDTTRLAASSPEMWLDILLQNRDPLVEALSSVETSSGGPATADRGGRSGRASSSISRPPASSAAASTDESGRHRSRPGRQEHHAPRAAARVRWARGVSHVGARSPRSTPAPAPVSCGSWERRSRRCARATSLADPGKRPLPRAGPDARLRQLGHDDAPAARAARRSSLPRDADRRCLAASPADATGHRAARQDGRTVRGARRRRSAAHRPGRQRCVRCGTRCRCRAHRSRARSSSPEWSGEVAVDLLEPNGRSRDHTERMLRAFGFAVGRAGRLDRVPARGPRSSRSTFRCRAIRLRPPSWWAPPCWRKAGELRIAGVGVNPTRTGFLRVLERMGAQVAVDGERYQLRRAGGGPRRPARGSPRARR